MFSETANVPFFFTFVFMGLNANRLGLDQTFTSQKFNTFGNN